MTVLVRLTGHRSRPTGPWLGSPVVMCVSFLSDSLRHKCGTILYDPVAVWLLSISRSLLLYLNVLTSRFYVWIFESSPLVAATQTYTNTQSCCPYKGLSMDSPLKVKSAKIRDVSTLTDPALARQGGGLRKSIIWPIFPQNCMMMKINWAEGRGRPSSTPP